jgi:hypothetical protein
LIGVRAPDAAVFLNGSYKRFVAGTTTDPYFAHLGVGVPTLGRHVLALTTAGRGGVPPMGPFVGPK